MDPITRFLGVPPEASATELLGLPSNMTESDLERALQDRLRMISMHPDGDSDEAQAVRQRIQRAAQTLQRERFGRGRWIKTGHSGPTEFASMARALRDDAKPGQTVALQPIVAPTPARSRQPSIQLTAFDRHVLAVLVGAGGWNAAARASLVSLASLYGVSVQGLIKVINGLSEFAKSGGGRFGVSDITSGAERMPPAPATLVRREAQWPARITREVQDRLVEEIRDDSLTARIRMSVFFALLTLLAAIFFVQLLWPPQADPQSSEPASNSTASITAPVLDRSTTRQPPMAIRRQPLARFDDVPIFRGDPRPTEAVEAADECPQLPTELDRLSRRIVVSNEPSEAVYRSWDDIVNIASTGWLLADDLVRRQIEQAVIDVLFAANDTPSVADRLLDPLRPSSHGAAEPLDVWRGAWMAGLLGRISADSGLAPATTDRARRQLEIALGNASTGHLVEFDRAAAAWLDHIVPGLIEVIEFDGSTYDTWECWLIAQRQVCSDESLNTSVIGAVGAMLATSVDLARPGPSSDVLGRLLATADFRTSPAIKNGVKAIFDDTERYDGNDLWVLTSLLAQYDVAPWFSEDLVLAFDADWVQRRRTADRIARRWPEVSLAISESTMPRGISVNPQVGQRWLQLAERLDEQSIGSNPERLMEQLTLWSWINEAAARLAEDEKSMAEEVLRRVAASIDAESDTARNAAMFGAAGLVDLGPARPAERRGQPIGADGRWATSFRESGRDIQQRLELLDALRVSSGTDLGLIDAREFVQLVYRGAPQEVRATAQAILGERFATGPNIALEMLNQFSQAPVHESISDSIRQLTGGVLPPARSQSWKIEARLALVEHAVMLRIPLDDRIDALSELVANSYVNQTAALRRSHSIAAAIGPADACRGLAEAWSDRAGVLVVSDPVPGPFTSLSRRQATRFQLAEGQLQQFVATQLGVLDMVAFVVTGEQPRLAATVRREMRGAADRRIGADHVLEQAVLIEAFLNKLWRHRLLIEGKGSQP